MNGKEVFIETRSRTINVFFFFGKVLSVKYGAETLTDRMKTFGSTQSGYVRS